jgi:3-hydroxyacyl-CoA dehydrogenase/enoyl-CoA hydratase/3-hydroxybutyryl-CoA epimerase
MIRRYSPLFGAGERMSGIRYQKDEQGVVTLVLDAPDQSVNTMNAAFRADLDAIVDRLEAEREDIRGVVLTSAKRTFFAGGDLHALLAVQPGDAATFFEEVQALKARLHCSPCSRATPRPSSRRCRR